MGMTMVSLRQPNSIMQAVLQSPTLPPANQVRMVTAAFFGGGHLRATARDMRMGTWNVEGLTDSNVVELQHNMMDIGLDVWCLQETHWTNTDCHVTDAGFLLILSGVTEHEELERAGVGFLVAPGACKSVVSCCQRSSRMVFLRIRVPSGTINLCSIYAPRSGKAFDERQTFYQSLAGWIAGLSGHGPLILLRDFKARLHKRFDSDPDLVSPYVFGKVGAQPDVSSNCGLLLEVCQKPSTGNCQYVLQSPTS